MASAAMRPLIGRPRRICSLSTTTGAGAEPLAMVLCTEATHEVTNLRHLRRVPPKEKPKEKAVEGDGEKSGVDGVMEGEGHCCKLAGRRIESERRRCNVHLTINREINDVMTWHKTRV